MKKRDIERLNNEQCSIERVCVGEDQIQNNDNQRQTHITCAAAAAFAFVVSD